MMQAVMHIVPGAHHQNRPILVMQTRKALLQTPSQSAPPSTLLPVSQPSCRMLPFLLSPLLWQVQTDCHFISRAHTFRAALMQSFVAACPQIICLQCRVVTMRSQGPPFQHTPAVCLPGLHQFIESPSFGSSDASEGQRLAQQQFAAMLLGHSFGPIGSAIISRQDVLDAAANLDPVASGVKCCSSVLQYFRCTCTALKWRQRVSL